MSVTTNIKGVPVTFPFQPYDIQVDYMEKVIECIQNETTAVLESPTGTGKTLSLLCSTLAWLQQKKTQIHAERQLASKTEIFTKEDHDAETPDFLQDGIGDVNEKANLMATGREFLALPTIIYASRTHSQLSQAMQELKRCSYNYMKASVLGSRDMLCINNEVLDQEDHSMRLNMCRLKVATKTCHYNNRIDKKKDDPDICQRPIVDIEDMVTLGKKHSFCPYYMTKEQQQRADIIFTPYNYLLDPIARKSLGLKLANSVVILDEGHNVEKVCEESASFELKSTDLALAIDEVTQIMKMLTEMPGLFEESPKEINPEEVASLKMILCNFEEVLDGVPIKSGSEPNHFPGDYIFEILEKAQISMENYPMIANLLDNLIQYLMAQNEGAFARKGKGLQLFLDLLTVVFSSKASKEKMKQCYKVHIKEEEVKKPGRASLSTWVGKGTLTSKNRILNYWCFSPGFGMDLIVSQGIKGLIITSGTLAPLRPLISELELDVKVRLENPHIVKANQICVKILPKGPDGEPLNSSFRNRDNPRYVSSLGRAIVNLSRIIPNGLLIFFPSYPIMQKCQNDWEGEGIWAQILSQKAIFVEPRGKEAFSAAMNGYYEKINDPKLNGAIFMGVCRGKVSEGLDFADYNGRAVIITGLPYPPLRDPRVILKQRYLDVCHAKDKEFLTGKDWYSLEASRAVNQAIGRVIRHRHDYGAILLLDERFNNPTLKNQMSRWLRDHITVVNKYGEMIRDLSQFFKKAQGELPTPEMKSANPPKASFDAPERYSKGVFNFTQKTAGSSSSDDSVIIIEDEKLVNRYLGTQDNPNGTVNLKRDRSDIDQRINSKKRHLVVTNHSIVGGNRTTSNPATIPTTSLGEYVTMVKDKLGPNFATFLHHVQEYRQNGDISVFFHAINPVVPRHVNYILSGMIPYVKSKDRDVYRTFLKTYNMPVPEDL